MVDNILYPDTEGMVLEIDVSNSGPASSVLYSGINGIHQNISVTHNGSATNILYPAELLEVIKKSNTYSRSRVVNK